MQQWDVEEGDGRASDYCGQHMQKLVAAFKTCGVTFAVWKSRQEGRDMNFTSLQGPDKQKLFAKLPALFADFLRPETMLHVKWLWEEFSELYTYLSA